MDILEIFGISQDWTSSSSMSSGSSATGDSSRSRESFFQWKEQDEEKEQESLLALTPVKRKLPPGPREWNIEDEENQPALTPLKRKKHHAAQRHITGKRRTRAKLIQTNFDSSPQVLGCTDGIEVDCCGLGDNPLPIFGFRPHMWPFAQHEQRLDPVLVAVEATAVCAMDLAMRHGAHGSDVPFPFALGSNFVGIVHRCSPEAEQYGITAGTRVTAIVKWGSNAKYVSAPAESLVVVPKHLDAADMACLISTYLPAFLALHHGRARPYRYKDSCLEGRRVLITGGATLEVQAVIRLARLAGADEIYVIAPPSHFDVLKKMQVGVLGEHPDEWLHIVRNRMHVVIDLAFPRNFSAVCESLAYHGRLVCSAPTPNALEKSWMSDFDNIVEYSKLSMMKRATLFDAVENVQTYREDVVQDLRFLLKLLSTRKIRPSIDRFIKVKDVPQAHQEMQASALTGAIVCEPWKE